MADYGRRRMRQTRQSTPNAVIPARLHPSGFKNSDSNFYSLSLASDDNIYYTLSSHDLNTHGRVYRYDPSRDDLRLLGDLGEITGETGRKCLPQGKSHTPFFEHKGRLFFATQYGFFQSKNDKEELASLPSGYQPYPGGHFIALDMKTGTFDDLVIAPPAEGILTMSMDPFRGRLYGLTWPNGIFIYFDLKSGRLRNLGPVSRGGEAGSGNSYFCLCRTFAVFPDDGSVYFTNADGQILCYDYAHDRIEKVEWAHMKRDIFGFWDPHQPGHQGYNWRSCLWHPQHRVFYGVHPKSGYLFRFDPGRRKLELIDRFCAEQLRENGRYEPFRYGYLTLALGPRDPDVFYYITGTYEITADDGRRVDTVLHLITYDLASGRHRDHGVIRLEDGRYPTNTQTMAVHPGGRVYTCPWIEKNSRKPNDGVAEQCDLISFADPVAIPETKPD